MSIVEAAKLGFDIVEYLLDPNTDINMRDEYGFTALHWAARLGNVKILSQLLTSEKLNINITDYSDWTPLHYAAQGGFKDFVQILLEQKGIDIEAKNKLNKKAKHVRKKN